MQTVFKRCHMSCIAAITHRGQKEGSSALILEFISLTGTARERLMDPYVHNNSCLNLPRRLGSHQRATTETLPRDLLPQRSNNFNLWFFNTHYHSLRLYSCQIMVLSFFFFYPLRRRSHLAAGQHRANTSHQ